MGLETTLKRPIINTRDEPDADPERYRRLHVIIGDANMSEVCTYLKVGTTVFIADEIQTGLCRTGDWFACDHEGVAKACREAGLVTLTWGTFGNVLRLLPPLVIGEDLLDEGGCVRAPEPPSSAAELVTALTGARVRTDLSPAGLGGTPPGGDSVGTDGAGQA